MPVEKNKEVVRRFFNKYTDSFNSGDTSVLDEVTADEFVFHGRARDNDREGMKQNILNHRVSASDYYVTIEDMVAEDDKVSIRATHHSTRKGKFGDTSVKVARYSIFRIGNGKVTELWSMDDMLSFYQQLGFLPPTEEIGK